MAFFFFSLTPEILNLQQRCSVSLSRLLVFSWGNAKLQDYLGYSMRGGIDSRAQHFPLCPADGRCAQQPSSKCIILPYCGNEVSIVLALVPSKGNVETGVRKIYGKKTVHITYSPLR